MTEDELQYNPDEEQPDNRTPWSIEACQEVFNVPTTREEWVEVGEKLKEQIDAEAQYRPRIFKNFMRWLESVDDRYFAGTLAEHFVSHRITKMLAVELFIDNDFPINDWYSITFYKNGNAIIYSRNDDILFAELDGIFFDNQNMNIIIAEVKTSSKKKRSEWIQALTGDKHEMVMILLSEFFAKFDQIVSDYTNILFLAKGMHVSDILRSRMEQDGRHAVFLPFSQADLDEIAKELRSVMKKKYT